MGLIEQIKASKNPLLIAEAKSIEQWKDLPHNKSGIEHFLQFNIAELRFKPKTLAPFKNIICTSNTQFISVFNQYRRSLKDKALKTVPFSGIFTKDSNSIMTYNLITKRYNTIYLSSWQIISFVSLIPENVAAIDAVVNNILNRKIYNN